MNKSEVLLSYLFILVDELNEKASTIYFESSIDSEGYNTLSVSNNPMFENYKNSCLTEIGRFISSGKYDVEKIDKILKARISMFDYYLNEITSDNIGTTLNEITDVYNDVLLDFIRSKTVL